MFFIRRVFIFPFQIGLVVLFLLLVSSEARAGMFEISGSVNYSKTTYGSDSFTWTRKWEASVAYYLTERSSIEFDYDDSYNVNNITGIEDTVFHDKTYSVNLVQHFAGHESGVQPFIKLGIGQLNRQATGSYASGGSPPLEEDQVTEIVGAGLKIYLTRSFGLRGEATSYITSGISSWKQNISVLGGLSFYF